MKAAELAALVLAGGLLLGIVYLATRIEALRADLEPLATAPLVTGLAGIGRR